MTELEECVEELIQEQTSSWKLANTNYTSLTKAETRVIEVDGLFRILQFNPERIRSSAANIDKASLQARPCFFCHRPVEQRGVPYKSDFEILVNPYPIFDCHLTIPLLWHEKQQILPNFEEMLSLASDLPDYFIFYNGPKCGASAPDHMHFQAGKKGSLPVMEHVGKTIKSAVSMGNHTTLYYLPDYRPSTLWLASGNLVEAVEAFHLIYSQLKIKPDEYEPMMNILVWMEEKNWNICLFPRRELRPSCFYAEGDANILISPATIEMSSLFITPLEKDFRKVTVNDLKTLLDEVSLPKDEMEKIVQHITAKR